MNWIKLLSKIRSSRAISKRFSRDKKGIFLCTTRVVKIVHYQWILELNSGNRSARVRWWKHIFLYRQACMPATFTTKLEPQGEPFHFDRPENYRLLWPHAYPRRPASLHGLLKNQRSWQNLCMPAMELGHFEESSRRPTNLATRHEMPGDPVAPIQSVSYTKACRCKTFCILAISLSSSSESIPGLASSDMDLWRTSWRHSKKYSKSRWRVMSVMVGVYSSPSRWIHVDMSIFSTSGCCVASTSLQLG